MKRKISKNIFITILLGSIFMLLESLIDLLAARSYGEIFADLFPNEAFISAMSTIFYVLAILGVMASIAILIVIYFAHKNGFEKKYLITILIIAIFSLFITSMLFSPMIVIVGCALGLYKYKK